MAGKKGKMSAKGKMGNKAKMEEKCCTNCCSCCKDGCCGAQRKCNCDCCG